MHGECALGNERTRDTREIGERKRYNGWKRKRRGGGRRDAVKGTINASRKIRERNGTKRGRTKRD